MAISLKLVIIPAVVLIMLLSFHTTLNLSFEKSTSKNSFVNKDMIPICCAWGPELQGGILTYSILGQTGEKGDKKIDDAVSNAVDAWNSNLKGMQIQKSPISNNADIFISFIHDGKTIAGKTVNSIDGNGFIRKSYITLSKDFFNRPFSSRQLEQVAEHELGHALGLNHANFNGNLMSTQVEKGSKTISPCVTEAVNIANSWKLQEGGVTPHGPTKSFVTC